MAEEGKQKASEKYDASKIKILGGIEAVRKRPAMYIGSTSKAGLHHLIYEVVDNSVDEALAGHCTIVGVTIHKDNSVTVEDDGRGIPFDIHPETKRPAVEVVLTTLHAGGKFGDTVYKVSGGLHGVGVSVVNALSEWMEARIWRGGKEYFQKFERGKPLPEKITATKEKEKTGTVITFKPDKEIFTETVFDYDTVKHRLQELAFLNRGLKIVLIDEREKEKKAETFVFEGGVKEFLEYLNKGKEILYKPPAVFSAEKEGVFVEVGLQHCKDYYDENIYSYVNCIRTREGGTHLIGLKSALTRAINNYGHKNNLIKENEVLQGEDVREGLTAVLNTRIPNPQFEGQTKTKLGNSEVKGIVDSIVVDHLSNYLDKNPASARAIIEKSLLAYRVRAAARKAQDLERKKSALDTAMLPGKLADCTETNAAKCELFMVEGDSAGGCFSGDTEIALTDGRNIKFKDLVKERGEGKRNYCYTIREDLSVGIEEILNPRITKEKASVIKIVLDNGEEIICTPDHKFMLRDGSYLEAWKLTPNISLMPFRRKLSELKGRITIEGYEMALNPETHKWVFTHLLADKYNIEKNKYFGDKDGHKHHRDFNKLNNNPNNIIRMPAESHLKLHRENAARTLHRKDVIEKCNKVKRSPEYRSKIAKTIKEKYGEMLSKKAIEQWEDDEYKEFMTQKYKEFYKKNPEYREKIHKILNDAQREYWGKEENRKKQAAKASKFFKEHPEMKKQLAEKAKNEWACQELLDWRREKTKKQWTNEFRAKREEAYSRTYLDHSLHFLKQVLETRGELFYYDWDRKGLVPKSPNLLSLKEIKTRYFEGDETKLIEAARNYNHKIIRIENLEEKIDVYDIEVPGTHNFALACGIFVHNSAKQGRDRKFQAILPLRGKILNVEKARLDKILTNTEIRTIITAIGPGVVTGLKGNGNGEKETELTVEQILKELRYHKIILMCDADVDGSHIRTLLLTFFYRYARELVDNGNIYIAQPPLYLIKKGKQQKYAYNDREMEKLIKEFGKEGVTVQRYKGLGEMNPDQLWETTMNPETRTLLQITLEDAEVADEIFKILMGTEVEPRREFIEKHAKEVKRLDV